MADHSDRRAFLFRFAANLKLIVLVTVVGFLFGSPAKTSGQLSGIPKVVTLLNGAQFEGEIYSVPTVGGLDPSPTGQKRVVVVDDGMRLIFFGQNRISPPLGDSVQDNSAIPIWQRVYPGDSPGFGHVTGFGPFDEHGHRTMTVQTRESGGIRTTTYIQGITEITPRHCEVKTLSIPNSIPGADRPMRDWTMRIATNSVPVEVLRSVLRSQIKDYQSPSEHLQIAEFFLKAQRYKQALNELRLIQRQSGFEDIREEIELRRKSVRQSYARASILSEIRLRLESGQTDYALLLAEKFNKDGLAGEILAEFMDIRNEIRNKAKLVEQTRTDIGKLISATTQANLLDQKQLEIVRRFQNELETDLNTSNLSRLDSYQQLANDQGMKVDRKIAIAISGWLTGSINAIDNFAVVQSMYPVRDIAEEFLSTANSMTTKLERPSFSRKSLPT